MSVTEVQCSRINPIAVIMSDPSHRPYFVGYDSEWVRLQQYQQYWKAIRSQELRNWLNCQRIWFCVFSLSDTGIIFWWRGEKTVLARHRCFNSRNRIYDLYASTFYYRWVTFYHRVVLWNSSLLLVPWKPWLQHWSGYVMARVFGIPDSVLPSIQ